MVRAIFKWLSDSVARLSALQLAAIAAVAVVIATGCSEPGGMSPAADVETHPSDADMDDSADQGDSADASNIPDGTSAPAPDGVQLDVVDGLVNWDHERPGPCADQPPSGEVLWDMTAEQAAQDHLRNPWPCVPSWIQRCRGIATADDCWAVACQAQEGCWHLMWTGPITPPGCEEQRTSLWWTCGCEPVSSALGCPL